MSWGERSCINIGKCDMEPTSSTCNVDCIKYEWDKKSTRDTVSNSQKVMSEVNKKYDGFNMDRFIKETMR